MEGEKKEAEEPAKPSEETFTLLNKLHEKGRICIPSSAFSFICLQRRMFTLPHIKRLMVLEVRRDRTKSLCFYVSVLALQ